MELLTKKQVSELLGVCPWTIDKWRIERGFPCRKIGRVVKFEKVEVLEWFRRTTNPGVSGSAEGEGRVAV